MSLSVGLLLLKATDALQKDKEQLKMSIRQLKNKCEKHDFLGFITKLSSSTEGQRKLRSRPMI